MPWVWLTLSAFVCVCACLPLSLCVYVLVVGMVGIQLAAPDYVGHPKITRLTALVEEHFATHASPHTTRVMVFSHYRDSVEEIVRHMRAASTTIRPMAFVGQARPLPLSLPRPTFLDFAHTEPDCAGGVGAWIPGSRHEQRADAAGTTAGGASVPYRRP
jgi:hypothetical protein